ncbi:DUF3311 domain-containing protein [Alicyclobacillus tolerans]|uniref:Permease n=2 Tax=Alicyclobacillus tolerans TaxID=90970 RepID=A0ABT9LSA3_9BACL|nr:MULTISPECIES: DUF3311 domain-containing protein [Alicyclobacillus]MDP9727140.1 hypothetical protein [Alicyclobacillus tengchongensis]QRF22909.1 DUF3311 domain-containing protein [Alicyclobacillus sp. TC]SHK47233.1 Protein of unknown function [Alicyclobacillus montanus]
MAIRWLACLPIIVIFGGVFFVNHVYPILLGMPFLFFYMVMAILFTSVCMAVIYHFDPANKEE